MPFWTIVKVSCASLMANKLRTFLAMLGIIIGVGAVISMLALGAGAKKQVIQRITSMGSNLLIVRSGGERRGGVRQQPGENLTVKDAAEILAKIDDVEAISPMASGRAQVKYYGENSNTTVTGAASTYLDIRNFEIAKGRNFTPIEEESSARVAILGASVAEQLFGSKPPVGERFRVKKRQFQGGGRPSNPRGTRAGSTRTTWWWFPIRWP